MEVTLIEKTTNCMIKQPKRKVREEGYVSVQRFSGNQSSAIIVGVDFLLI